MFIFANFTLALFMLNNKKLGEHINIYNNNSSNNKINQ
jgi:hypothetical protein